MTEDTDGRLAPCVDCGAVLGCLLDHRGRPCGLAIYFCKTCALKYAGDSVAARKRLDVVFGEGWDWK